MEDLVKDDIAHQCHPCKGRQEEIDSGMSHYLAHSILSKVILMSLYQDQCQEGHEKCNCKVDHNLVVVGPKIKDTERNSHIYQADDLRRA